MRKSTAKTRIDMRINPQSKYFFELAAFIGGYDSLTSFIEEASERLAKTVLDSTDESRTLSDRDRDLLLNFLKNAPEPNSILRATFEKISKIYSLNEDGDAIYNIDRKLLKNHSEQSDRNACN